MSDPPPLIILYLAWLLRRDWARWRALDPSGLQKLHAQWKRNAETLEREMAGAGRTIIRVVLDPQEFAAWCRQTGVEPNGKARQRYATQLGERRNLH